MIINIYPDQSFNSPSQSKPMTPTTNDGQKYVWRRQIFNARGQFLTIELTFSDAQMANISQNDIDIAIQAMSLYFQKGQRLIYGGVRG